jgi:plasmid stability protein
VFDGSAGSWVDLTLAFSESTIYWPSDTRGFEREELAHDRTEGGWFYPSYRFSTAEPGGTTGRLPSVARCHRCWHYASMAIQITIRDVPEKVRDELAARAALQGKSMQEYLRSELERLAARPSVDAWLEQVRKRKRASRTRVPSAGILKERDADRR